MLYFCCDDRRLEVIRGGVMVDGVTINAIDYLEVDSGDQRILHVHFVHPLPSPPVLKNNNVVIQGGERITRIRVKSADTSAANPAVLDVTVDTAGDFSTYTLKLVNTDPKLPLNGPPAGFDVQLSAIDFSFKVNCPSDFDCKTVEACSTQPPVQPEIDYLSKDYASFRQLMLNRLGILVPQWTETNPSDIGLMLVELMAYVGDYLSYRQDAVATEAYLGTARRRISIRRHARLLDYAISEGSNARVWVHFDVTAPVTLPIRAQILTRVADTPIVLAPGSFALQQAMAASPEVFETMHPAKLDPNRNLIPFYTWGATQCCLPSGATSATLKYPPAGAPGAAALAVGDILIFEEQISPTTGLPQDADVTHRHSVRLTAVAAASDPIGGQFDDPPTSNAVQLTQITWAQDDALPFPLCISAVTDAAVGATPVTDVSVARGNVALADHGMTITGESLGQVPQSSISKVASPGTDRCSGAPPEMVPPRFNPALQKNPVTQAAPFALPPPSAAAAMTWLPTDPVPQVTELLGVLGQITEVWGPAQKDLLSSAPEKLDFAVEVESDGTAFIRFGDGEYGLRPAPGTTFSASYRVGNGVSGNVGADALAHLVTGDKTILAASKPVISIIRNPIPASGGVEPESIEHVRQHAPAAFTIQERAVTADDYAAITERRTDIQRAAATVRWTGSWQTVFVSADRKGAIAVDQPFKDGLTQYLEPFRMAGRDVEIEGPVFVSLDIAITVCVMADYVSGDVEGDLLDVFSNRVLPDGSLGFFHPDNFTFGQPVYLSAIYAAAQSVQGVMFVDVTRFQRQGISDKQALLSGVLDIERLEIARLDNDPNFPEHGAFSLTMQGGR